MIDGLYHNTTHKGYIYELFIKDVLRKKYPDDVILSWKDVPESEMHEVGLISIWNKYRVKKTEDRVFDAWNENRLQRKEALKVNLD